MPTTTIKPGILVALRSSVEGGVRYQRRDLPADAAVAEGAPPSTDAAVARWETTRIVEDAAEHDRASKVRGAALKLISAICVRTSFGLLAPRDAEEALDKAHQEAVALVQAFNADARTCRVGIYLLKGRIAESDAEAVRAIGSEVRSLIDEMNRGISNLDVETVRSAASKALEMGAVLGEEEQAKVSAAVAQARAAARMIVKRVSKGGEAGAAVLATIQRGDIEKARMAFLDMNDSAAPAEGASLPDVEVRRTAALDFDDAPAPAEAPPAPPRTASMLDFGDDAVRTAPPAATQARVPEMTDAL